MELKDQKPTKELEPIIDYEDCTDYVPSSVQLEYEENIRRRMKARRRAAERRRVNRNRTIALILLLIIIFVIVRSCTKGGGENDKEKDQTSSVSQSEPDKHNDVRDSSDGKDKNGGSVRSAGEHKIEQSNGMTFVDGILIVNKTYSLPADYDPGVSAAAQNAFDEMSSDAMNDGIYLFVNSGYRSYAEQVELYDGYAYERGVDEADKVSSRPGHSEHQTGLTFDVNSTEFSFEDTAEARWLAAHCSDYGFIIRYPKGKEDITGFAYEPWHIRYLGVENAKAVEESGLCLEEYLGVTSDYADAENTYSYDGETVGGEGQDPDNSAYSSDYGGENGGNDGYGYGYVNG